MKKAYTQTAEEVQRDLDVGAEGLTTSQAQERLAKYGPNKLKEAEKPTLLQRFIAQLKKNSRLMGRKISAGDRAVFFVAEASVGYHSAPVNAGGAYNNR